MKWNLHNEYIESIPKKKLNRKIEKSGLTHFIIDTIVNNKKNNDTITFLTNNNSFLEKTVKKIVGLCYKKEIRLNTAIDNHNCIYQYDKYDQHDQLKDDYKNNNNDWYFTFSKVSFDSDNKNTICYYFNFVNKNRNFHLTLMLDEDMN